MKKITVSAPGKLILFGEHAVLYNRPCLVTAVDQRMKATVELLDKPEFQLNAPDVNCLNYKKDIRNIGRGKIPKGAIFVEIAVKNFIDIARPSSLLKGIKITTKSEFSSQLGFGSSSASTVCVIKALSELFNVNLTQKEIFDLSYQTVLEVQGAGSGFDVAAAVYGGTLYFIRTGKTIDPLNISHLPFIVAYSGLKADTVKLINQVKEKSVKEPSVVENIYNQIQEIVEKAKITIKSENWEKIGNLMNKNQQLLFQLGVSAPQLDNMIAEALRAGAYGAKLSGAGGGDCIIALVHKNKKIAVRKSIESAGGEIIPVQVNAPGARIES